MTRIAIVGLGPVGLATAVTFTLEGHEVAALDVVSQLVEQIRRGEPPVYEAGLATALQKALATRRLRVTGELAEALPGTDIIFLCVGTPSLPDGSMDDSFLRAATEDVASELDESGNPIVVVKSTVVPGTTERVVHPILRASGKPHRLGVNPEFLREGHALEDSLHPTRIVIGVSEPSAAQDLRELYHPAPCPLLETDLRTAEAIKYATNAFLATKVAFAGEMADLCAVLGVSYDEVIEGVKLDPRVNPRFLVPGVGFGGSCFPKDVRALVSAGKAAGHMPTLLEAVLSQNETQYLQAIKALEDELGNLKGRRIALLGLSFKGHTDDVRESRAVPIARALIERGASVTGYDPKANEKFRAIVPEIQLASSAREALQRADGCIVQAEWPEFIQMEANDFLKPMKTPVVVDGRRILDPAKMVGLRFRRIGEPPDSEGRI